MTKYEGVSKQELEHMKTIWVPFQIWKCPSCKKSVRYESMRKYEESFCNDCGIRREEITEVLKKE